MKDISKIGIYVNREASGVDEDEELSDVEYWIRNNKLYDWCNDEVLDLNGITVNECEDLSWTECFMESLICKVLDDGLEGSNTLEEHIDNDYVWLVLLYDENDNIIEEIGELNPKNFI